MKVYRLRSDRAYNSVQVVAAADISLLNDAANGGPPVQSAGPIMVEYCGDTPRTEAVVTELLNPDYGCPLLSDRAVEALAPLLQDAGYFIPATFPCDLHYQFFICEREIEAFDDERSDCVRYSDGHPWHVMRFELDRDAVQGSDIFRLKLFRAALFVSDRFVAAVQQHALSGFWFEELWSSETGGVQRTREDAQYGHLTNNPRTTHAAKRAALRAKQAAQGPVPKFL